MYVCLRPWLYKVQCSLELEIWAGFSEKLSMHQLLLRTTGVLLEIECLWKSDHVTLFIYVDLCMHKYIQRAQEQARTHAWQL